MLGYLKTLIGREIRVQTNAEYSVYGILKQIVDDEYIDLDAQGTSDRKGWYENVRIKIGRIHSVYLYRLNWENIDKEEE